MIDDVVKAIKSEIRGAEVRGILKLFLSRKRTTDYVTVAKALGMFSGGSELAGILGNLQIDDNQAGDGLISSLVVSRKTGVPGRGYFENARKALSCAIPDDPEQERAFWEAELKKLDIQPPARTIPARLEVSARRVHEDLAPMLQEAIGLRTEAVDDPQSDKISEATALEDAIATLISHAQAIYAGNKTSQRVR